jgi:MFS family permease
MLFGMLSTQVILLFCGFGLIYLGYIVINVIVSAILLDSDRAKNYKIVSNLQLFAQIGSLSSILIYLLLISATNYTIFLYILIAIGIVFLIVAWKYIPPQNQPFRPSPQLATPTASLPADHKRLFTTTILLIVLLCIFTRVNSMASFLFSPWLVTTFGSANFTLYQIVMFVMGVVSIGFLGLVVRWANFIGQHRIHLIIFTGVFFVMNWLVIAWGSFLAILIITSFTTLLEVLLSFSLLTIIIDGTPRTNRTFWYQTYSGVMVGATILFNVLGIVISAASNDTVIYVLIAILIAVNIPILLRLHITKFKETFTVSQSPDSQQ